jgi:hypothetical protein
MDSQLLSYTAIKHLNPLSDINLLCTKIQQFQEPLSWPTPKTNPTNKTQLNSPGKIDSTQKFSESSRLRQSKR